MSGCERKHRAERGKRCLLGSCQGQVKVSVHVFLNEIGEAEAIAAAEKESSMIASEHTITAVVSSGFVKDCDHVSSKELALRGIDKHFAILLKV